METVLAVWPSTLRTICTTPLPRSDAGNLQVDLIQSCKLSLRSGKEHRRIRDQLKFDLPDPAQAVRMAMESKAFPVTLLDTGDNVGGGGAGDSTFILAELVKQKADGWVIPIFDPKAVQQAVSAGVGQPFAFGWAARRTRCTANR